MNELKLLSVDLALFNNTNKTTDALPPNGNTTNDLSGEMKTFYSDYLIDLAEPELVHDQFGQKHPIPRNGGKTIEFRKYDSLPKALQPLEEGVTPNGQKLNMGVLVATIEQFGGYVELSDTLLLTAIDNNLVQATKLLASQAGRTLDTITREVLAGGTNVQIGDDSKLYRSALVGGESSGNDYLTVKDIRIAVRALKVMNTPKINGDYVGIIHPDCEFDIMDDPDWKYPHQYVDTDNLYSNEIGKVAGVRFVETTEAKVWQADGLTAAARNLTVSSYSSKVITTAEAITADEATALVGRKILVGTAEYTVSAATAGAAGAGTITIEETPATNPTANTVIYPGEAGAKGRNVYATLILGDNAYGVTEVSGGGLQHIVKQLGSSGTADPLSLAA